MLGLALFSLLFTSDLPAQDPGAYMRQIWSPYCKGVSLMECPSSKAEVLRNEINDRMGKGESFESVYSDLTKRYGSTLRMSPEFEGREAAAFWIPWVMAIAVGVFILGFWMTRRRRKISPAAKTYQPNLVLESRIQHDLDDLRN